MFQLKKVSAKVSEEIKEGKEIKKR